MEAENHDKSSPVRGLCDPRLRWQAVATGWLCPSGPESYPPGLPWASHTHPPPTLPPVLSASSPGYAALDQSQAAHPWAHSATRRGSRAAQLPLNLHEASPTCPGLWVETVS